MTTSNSDQVAEAALKINGARVALGEVPGGSTLDRLLRGIALSDSPVLIRADREGDRQNLVAKLHAFGRRSALPLRECTTREHAAGLFRAVLGEAFAEDIFGTWALHGVAAWSPEDQRALGRILGVLDECRLHGRLAHERIPRIIVVEPSTSGAALDPELEERLRFFNIAAS